MIHKKSLDMASPCWLSSSPRLLVHVCLIRCGIITHSIADYPEQPFGTDSEFPASDARAYTCEPHLMRTVHKNGLKGSRVDFKSPVLPYDPVSRLLCQYPYVQCSKFNEDNLHPLLAITDDYQQSINIEPVLEAYNIT